MATNDYKIIINNLFEDSSWNPYYFQKDWDKNDLNTWRIIFNFILNKNPKYRISPIDGTIYHANSKLDEKYGLTQVNIWNLLHDNDKDYQPLCPLCRIRKCDFSKFSRGFCPTCSDCQYKSKSIARKAMSPGSWTEEECRYYGYTGKSDPKYLERCKLKYDQCSKAGVIGGTITTKLHGLSFNPYSWTEEQIKSRGYSGIDDPEYLKVLENYSKSRSEIASKMQAKYGNPSLVWSYKVFLNTIYGRFRLDSIRELADTLITLIHYPEEVPIEHSRNYGYTCSDMIFKNSITGVETDHEVHGNNIKYKKLGCESYGDKFLHITLEQAEFYLYLLKSYGYDIDGLYKAANFCNIQLNRELEVYFDWKTLTWENVFQLIKRD